MEERMVKDHAESEGNARGSEKENEREAGRTGDNGWHCIARSKPSMSFGDIKCNREIILNATLRSKCMSLATATR